MQRHIFAIVGLFTLGFPTIFSQNTLYIQSGNPTDNWSFNSTGADATAAAQALNSANYTSAPQSLVVGGNTGGGSCIDGGSGNGPSVQRTFTFDQVNINSSNQFNRALSFKWGNRHPVCTGTGWDTGENLIFIPIHNGVEQSSQTLAVGGSDALFPIQNNTFNYTIPPCVNTFGFILYVTTNRRDELLFLDDVLLTTPNFNQPVAPIVVNQSFCQNELPIQWNGQQISTAGTYNVSLTTDSGCDSLVQLNVTVLPNSQSNQQLSVCQNELPILINGTNITAAGTYVLNYLNSSGCDSLVNLTVDVLPAQQSFQQVTICENDLPLVINNSNITSSGTYNFNFQTASGCDSIATFVVVINQNQQSTQNVAVCPQEVPYTWNGQQISTSGTYTANFTSSSGCDSTATLNFTVRPIPSLNFSADNTVIYLENPVVNFTNNSSNFDQMSWDFGDGSPIVNTTEPIHTFPSIPGNYTVSVTASLNNCSVSGTINIVVQENADFTFVLPNVFTPNEDGSNDNFTNSVENSAAIELVILNRWGGVVFLTNDASDSWNGKEQNIGALCSEGVYLYKLTITDKANKTHIYNSFVHLIR